MTSQKTQTLAIHAGSVARSSKAIPVVSPLHVSAVSYFDDAGDLDRSLDGADYVYARNLAQNAALLEEAVAALEGAEACAAYASGMAALKALLEAQPLTQGDRVVMPSDCYGSTRALFKSVLEPRGVEIHSLLLTDAGALSRIVSLRPKMVLAESITNPLVSVVDLRAISKACREVDAALAVDATFASPVLQRPIELGADYAIQSTTKWINGHSDALGGTVSGSRQRIDPLKSSRVLMGSVLGPFEAWLTLRGLRTLPVRMRVHCENAAQVAKKLSSSPRLERVLYPGLPSHPQHRLAQELLRGGFGGMLAFHLRGAGRAEAFRFLESVRLAKAAPSLGDVTTLVMHAATASARRMTPAEREAVGIGENLIRVSVGLEDSDDIAEDLLQAAARATER